MQTQKQKLGQWGEEQACSFLVRQGYEIVERNFNLREGEIDIIAKKLNQGVFSWHFIEVKTRSYGEDSAERAVDWRKIQKMVVASKIFCVNKRIDIDSCPIHFEQISVYVDRSKKILKIKKYELPIFEYINKYWQ